MYHIYTYSFIIFLTFFGFQVALRSSFLGSVLALGLYLTSLNVAWRAFGLYLIALSIFHFSEFFAVALTNPQTLTIDSFILNHSIQYWLAAISSWIEMAIESYFFPGEYFYLKCANIINLNLFLLLYVLILLTTGTNLKKYFHLGETIYRVRLLAHNITLKPMG